MKHHEPTLRTTAGSAVVAEPVDHRQVIACLLGRPSLRMVDVCVDLWERLAAGLVTIIGNEGFYALYDRSLHLAGEAFPWLSAGDTPAGAAARFVCLRANLQGRDHDEASMASVLLLTTFLRVLVSLIGHPLTTNLLRAAWGGAYDAAAHETSQWPKK